MVEEINKSFKRISRNLFGSSLNYCANFKLYRCERMAGESLERVVTVALGKGARIGGAQLSSKNEIIEDLHAALNFEGDRSSHPNLNYLGSYKFKQEFDSVSSKIREILEESDHILSFWLDSGHPFYPVFWDFAYLIELKEDSLLFIASSSD